MKNKKNLIILSVIALLCLCLCLFTFGKNSKTDDATPGNNTVKDSEQQQDQPKIVHQENGSGVETVDANWNDQQTASFSGGESSSTQSGQVPGPVTPVQSSTTKLSSAAQEYADYCAMSADEQYAYYKSFKSADAFMQWYNTAQAAYNKENPVVVLNPGDAIDLGK